MGKRSKLAVLLTAFQVVFIILFAVFVRYDPNADAAYHPRDQPSSGKAASKLNPGGTESPVTELNSGLLPGTVLQPVFVTRASNAVNLTDVSIGNATTPMTVQPTTGADATAAPTMAAGRLQYRVDSTDSKHKPPSKNGLNSGLNFEGVRVSRYYPMFQDVHVMIFVGFGFLMTFLKRYGFGSVGLNFLISAFVIQWAILMSGFLNLEDGKIFVNITSMISADFAAAAVLISFGAVLGKASPVQLMLMSFLEIIFFAVNERIGVHYLKAVDVGGSMFVHAFGAYFGLTVSRVIYKRDIEESTKEGSVYHSDLFSMIGTIFLWMYWPSFNAALAPGDDQHRAVINTYLALTSCCVVTFAISSVINKDGKLNMVHIQNSTLAGGVAVGTSADMMIEPFGALVIGAVAGIISVIGYSFITPCLNSRAKIHDTCGVNNLHGMPAILAAIAGAVAAALAGTEQYGYSLYEIFPARAPATNTTDLLTIQSHLSGVVAGDGRNGSQQAGYQLLAITITVAIAIVGGLITGFILRIPLLNQPSSYQLFEDDPFFELPEAESGGNMSSFPLNETGSGHGGGNTPLKGSNDDVKI